jgi:hypothetical protein
MALETVVSITKESLLAKAPAAAGSSSSSSSSSSVASAPRQPLDAQLATLPRFARLTSLKLILNGMHKKYMCASGVQDNMFSHPLSTREAQAAYEAQVAARAQSVFELIEATCPALVQLDVSVGSFGEYTSKKEKSRGLSMSPPPLAPAVLGLHLGSRLTHLKLSGFTYPPGCFDGMAVSQLRSLKLYGVGAQAALASLTAKADYPESLREPLAHGQ